jgi:acetyl-CoA acetyltransferase
MSIKGKAYIAGAYEHPTRHAPDKSVAQLHAEVALGALADAGLTRDDVDGYFCAGDAPGPSPRRGPSISISAASTPDINCYSFPWGTSNAQ